MSLSAIVLAAGEGTRMRSQRPKPLHLICGRPMVMHVIHSLSGVRPTQTVIVVGHGADQVTARVTSDSPSWANVSFASQIVQRGTGDALSVGLIALDQTVATTVTEDQPAEHDDRSTILVLPGDTPLLRRETIDHLVAQHEASGDAATVLVAELENPTGYGRVVRSKDGKVIRIVEQRDASDEERQINEINTSIYAFRRDLLGPALRRVTPNNAQSEYYLTDIVAVLVEMGHQVGAVVADAPETQGVNDRWQLALAESELRSRTNHFWLLNGVTMFDPRQTFIDVDVHIECDVTLYPGTMLQGNTRIGVGSQIGPNTRLVNCIVGSNSFVESTSARDSLIGDHSIVGPFAHLSSGSRVTDGQTTGAFYDSESADSKKF